MNKSAAGYCHRLYESIREKYGEDKAVEICGEGVAASATPQKKGRWAAETMDRLQAAFGGEALAGLLAPCACGPGQAQLEAARKLWKKCRSLEEYADRRNAERTGGARFEARDGLLYVSYPQCYCSMVKNAAGPVPKAWCQCSCEYIRRACAYAFDGDVEVKLLKSRIAGDEACLFEVKVQ